MERRVVRDGAVHVGGGCTVTAQQQWRSPDGRRLTVVEDTPGVVHITTEALEHLLTAAGMTRLGDSSDGGSVDAPVPDPHSPRTVQRDSHGRCTVCGTTPATNHRMDCPHYVGDAHAFWRDAETRPAGDPTVERR